MTATILAILTTLSGVIAELIKSQTPEQAQILWDRYIQLTDPLHRLLIKLEGLQSITVPTAPSSTAPLPVTASILKAS
jgi:hypothetical protein